MMTNKFKIGNPECWRKLGLFILDIDPNSVAINSQERKFIAFYGCNWHVCHDIWTRISVRFGEKEKTNPKHLLWSLMLAKLYGFEDTQAVTCKTTSKTWRKWAWHYLEKIADLNDDVVRKNHSFFLFLVFILLFSLI